MESKKLDEIISRLSKIERKLKEICPDVEYELYLNEGGEPVLTHACCCGSSARCYKCFPIGSMSGDLTPYTIGRMER